MYIYYRVRCCGQGYRYLFLFKYYIYLPPSQVTAPLFLEVIFMIMENCVCISKEFLKTASQILTKEEIAALIKILNVVAEHGPEENIILSYFKEEKVR